MRLWLTYILNQTPLAEDFASDMTTRANSLISMQNKAILDKDFDKATQLAYEANVYMSLVKMVNKELREQRAQIERENATA